MQTREPFKLLVLAALLSCIVIFSSSASSQVNNKNTTSLMSKSEFAEQALLYKQKITPEHTFELEDDLSITTTREDGSQFYTYLDNAYSFYKNNPNDIDDIFVRFFSPFDTSTFDESSTQAKLASLMPVLKDDIYINNVRNMVLKQDSKAPFPLYYESLNNGLNLLYVFDTETTMQYLNRENIEELGVSDDQLRNRAIKNLMTAVPELGVSGDSSFVSYLIADENYEASFLLVDQLWNKDNFPVKGDIIVYAISRSIVLITGSEDTQGIATILNIKNDPDAEIPHALATSFLIRQGDKWEVFVPESSSVNK